MAFGDRTTERASGADQRALRVLAKSVFKELKGAGYSRGEMVAFAGELLNLVTLEIKTHGADDDEDETPVG